MKVLGRSSLIQRIQWSRWAHWALLAVAGLLAWALFMIAAILQKQFFILFFPAGWCLYVAVRQFRLLQPQRSATPMTQRQPAAGTKRNASTE